MPHNSIEPLYVGVDVDALLAKFDQEDRRREAQRHASCRRHSPALSPLLIDLETRFAIGAPRPPALRCAHLA